MKKMILFFVLVSIGMFILLQLPIISHTTGTRIFWDQHDKSLEFYKESMLGATPNYSKIPKLKPPGISNDNWALGALWNLKNRTFTENEKEDILAFLEKYTKTFLNDQSFISKGISFEKRTKYYEDPVAAYLPEIAMEVILKIDTARGLKFIENVWKSHLNIPDLNSYFLKIREKLLDKLIGYYKNDSAMVLVNKLKTTSKIKIIERQVENIERMNFYNQLSKIQSDSAAWAFVWEVSPTKTKKAYEILSFVDWRLWSGHTLYIDDIFPKTDLKPILELIKKAESPQKKFIFLGCSCRMMHIFNFRKETPDDIIEALNPEDIEELKSLFKEFFTENPEFLIEEKGANKSNGVIALCKRQGVLFD